METTADLGITKCYTSQAILDLRMESRNRVFYRICALESSIFVHQTRFLCGNGAGVSDLWLGILRFW